MPTEKDLTFKISLADLEREQDFATLEFLQGGVNCIELAGDPNVPRGALEAAMKVRDEKQYDFAKKRIAYLSAKLASQNQQPSTSAPSAPPREKTESASVPRGTTAAHINYDEDDEL